MNKVSSSILFHSIGQKLAILGNSREEAKEKVQELEYHYPRNKNGGYEEKYFLLFGYLGTLFSLSLLKPNNDVATHFFWLPFPFLSCLNLSAPQAKKTSKKSCLIAYTMSAKPPNFQF